MVEVLVVIAIIALIIGVTIAAVQSSKNKALDADTRKSISEVAFKAEAEEISPGVIDYNAAFTASGALNAITNLATRLKITNSDYQYSSTSTSYVIAFPLKKGGYYCVDSVSHAAGSDVVGLIESTGPQDCSNATRIIVRPLGWE